MSHRALWAWVVAAWAMVSLENAGASAPHLTAKAVLPEAGSVTSRSGLHKVLIPRAASPALDSLRAMGSVRRSIDYGTFRLLVVGDDALPLVESLREATLRDDLDQIAINRWVVDGREGEPSDLPEAERQQPALFDPQLAVVQFVGPARDRWLDRLGHDLGVRVVGYLPNDAYLVLASPTAWDAMSRRAASGRGPIQWVGVYHPAYRTSPHLDAAIARDDEAVDVVVELIDSPRGGATAERIRAEAASILADDVVLAGLRDVRVRIPASSVRALAGLPDVVWIEPCLPKRKLDERQGQILAANLNATGSQPSAPGYFAWLGARGFTSLFPFAVDVADDGFDRGSTTDVHRDFKDEAGASRVAYALNYSADSTADGGAGHGTLNAAIVGGFNDVASDSAFVDAQGFHYGLGIAPRARIGSSKIFSNDGSFTSAAYSVLISRAYAHGARVSSNSWGLSGAGANEYTSDSRSYDVLVRDAQSGTAGNQEMAIVFAAGNDGPGASTVGAPGTAKNVIAAGASENVRLGGTDGCGVGDSGADDARDVIDFSSRGPTADGRHKPDVMAPGTHVQGAASRSPVYDGSGVCDRYWPSGQTNYCWSSGTSHSTPAVAGCAALVRQHFANRSLPAPSPAMTKAFLVATADYLTGAGAHDTLPSNAQGYGRVDLGRAFDGTPDLIVDETHVFGAAGETFTTSGSIADPGRPLRVVLAWTDAPGTLSGSAWVNDLDLEVAVNGTTYRGNVFAGATSAPGGAADARNNVEAVFLPPGVSGALTITVRAAAVNGDGVPGNADATDQDFALYVYNGSTAPPQPDFAITVGPVSASVVQGSSVTVAVTVRSLAGFNAPVGLAIGGLPARVTARISPTSVTPAAGGTATASISLAASKTAAPGTYGLVVTGTSGGFSHAAPLGLTITQPDIERTLTFSAAPRAAIPDVDATGVESTITVPDSMTITSVSVFTGITHPRRSDLVVSLVAPDGTNVVLHELEGGTSRNLRTTFEVTTRSKKSLGVLKRKNSRGTWTLRVRDLVAADTGTLDRWQLTFNGYRTTSTSRAIPDGDANGTTSTIHVTAQGTISSLRVRVNVTHTRKSDLQIRLTGPDGTSVLLHDHSGGTANDVSTVYPDLTRPRQSLTAFAGKRITGAWKLQVIDDVTGEIGTLRSWELDARAR
ncbi:MAG: S8 family serine peptidase [Planctomycetes bacterium]|nr:S8 family serine peptidase [Planctomycetota bacterium]MBI3847990.1 S8 family serine peptidase [Planctomycetota bacterium]